MTTSAKLPTPVIVRQQATLRDRLPFSDVADFDDASCGLIGRLEPCVVRAADGRVVWDNDSYGFLARETPDSMNPSLWRRWSLVARDGLFEAVEGIYQIRAALDAADPDVAIVTPGSS